MGALDKLNIKVNNNNTANVIEKTSIPKVEEKKPEKKVKVATSRVDKEKASKPTEKKKHPGGRTNTRGQAGKDYRMLNVAVPIDVYEKLKASSNGNMTYFINELFRKTVEE